MLSSRRVKKGPGRRPQSAKRQKFMELRERGWSIRAAAREVGVSRSSGNSWASGSKTYRNGLVIGFVPPLDRLLVRQISPRFLSQDERIEIADLRSAGQGVRQIAAVLHRAPSTISRELRRNTLTGRIYRPFDAHRHATGRRARHHRRRVETNLALRQLMVGFSLSGGARSRSAATCDPGSPTTLRCACVTRASTKPSINRILAFVARRGLPRTVHRRCGPDGIIGVHTSAVIDEGRGSSSRC